MPAEKATAIVLRTVEFSESSLVVTLFSREFGKLGALAKGGRRPKGPFESALDVLAVCRIVFLRRSSDALDLLTEAKLLRRFRPPGTDVFALYAGYYLAELLQEMTDDYDPHPELFDLADHTLEALSRGGAVRGLVVRFELGALRLLGHMPSLDHCVECGCRVPEAGSVAFGLQDGGVLCPRCRPGKRQVATISPQLRHTLALSADPNSDAWKQLDTDRLQPQRGPLRGLLNAYLTNLLGKKPRLHRYLEPLWR